MMMHTYIAPQMDERVREKRFKQLLARICYLLSLSFASSSSPCLMLSNEITVRLENENERTHTHMQ